MLTQICVCVSESDAGRLYREQSREYESTDQYNVITAQPVNQLETLWLERTLRTPHLLTFIYTLDSSGVHKATH